MAINESCTFSEECEAFMDETECKNDVCTCRFEKLAVSHGDGWWECTGKIKYIIYICKCDSKIFFN